MSQLGVTGSFQKDYSFRQSIGRVGLFTNIIHSETMVNSASEAVKIATLALSSASGNQVITITGIAITTPYTTSDANTAVLIASGINANPLLYAKVKATVNTATITITGRYTGDDFTITYSGTGGTLTTDGSGASQVAVESSHIPQGRLVAFRAGDTEGTCRLPSANNDIILGIAGSHTTTEYNENGLGFQRGALVGVLKKGLGFAEVEATTSVTKGASIYYRYAADGTFNKLGALAATSGTGKKSITNLQFNSAAFTSDGILIAEVSANLL